MIQVHEAVGEAPEVLLALQTLAEHGIEEEDIWNGKPGTHPRHKSHHHHTRKLESDLTDHLRRGVPFAGALQERTQEGRR
jgi:hypothetical protein